jgi:hypothetical protein
MCGSAVKAYSEVGICAGLNVSHDWGWNAPEYEPSLGYNLGIFAAIPLLPSNNFRLQAEARFTTKGINYTEDALERQNTYYYMEVPLLLKYSIGTGSLKLQPYAGISLAYLIAARQRVEADDPYTVNISKNMNKEDVALNLGVDVVIDPLVIGVRFNRGWVNIFKEDEFLGYKHHNQTLMLNLGLTL